jgi:hypothetical protein
VRARSGEFEFFCERQEGAFFAFVRVVVRVWFFLGLGLCFLEVSELLALCVQA